MKILLLKADNSGCGFYRISEPARAVVAVGTGDVNIEIDDGLDVEYHNDVLKKVRTDADVVVFQRPMQRHLLNAIRILKEQGVRVVVELDDDLERVPPTNTAYMSVHPTSSPDANWRILKECCREADWMVVSTPALERYKPGKATVVRNRVPGWAMDIDHVGGKGVGWSGSVVSHWDDLLTVGSSLMTSKFHVVGIAEGVQKALMLTDPPTESGWSDAIPDYYEALAQLDVGIAPLAGTTFNDAKSYLKIMEMSAVGVPWVAGPSAEYQVFYEMSGGGFIAKKPRDWRRFVDTLMENDVLRLEMSEWLRDHIRSRHLVEDAADEWLDAWTRPLH